MTIIVFIVDIVKKTSLETTLAPLQKIPELELVPKNTDTGSPKVYGGNSGSEVLIKMNPKSEDPPASFFAQPGILAGKLNMDKRRMVNTN